jgi:hypothetical protein
LVVATGSGSGRGTRFSFSREGALAREVAHLFKVEQDRGTALTRSLRRTLRSLSDPPQLAWVKDFLAGWPDRHEVGVFHEDGCSPVLQKELEQGLRMVEAEFEIALEVKDFSGEGVASVDWSKAMVLRGTPPGFEKLGTTEGESAENPLCGNGKLNPKSPEFSGALAALLAENLSVLRRARENVQGKLKAGANGDRPELWEWHKILDTFSLPKLLHFLESDSPRAERLRECSPFPAVLSEEERTRLEELAQRVVH